MRSVKITKATFLISWRRKRSTPPSKNSISETEPSKSIDGLITQTLRLRSQDPTQTVVFREQLEIFK